MNLGLAVFLPVLAVRDDQVEAQSNKYNPQPINWLS